MNYIDIHVAQRHATHTTSDQKPVCGNSDYLIRFAFDAEWDDHENKTARFVTENGHTDVLFAGTECPMPMLSGVRWVEIGVYAGDLQTTTPAYVPVDRSILCGNAPVHPDPPEDLYNQLLERLNEIQQNTVDPEDIEQAVVDYMEDHPIEEADPTVPAWAKEAERPTYTAEDVGALSEETLKEAVDAALAQAKESGEFDGKDGEPGKDGNDGTPGAAGKDGTSVTVASVSESTEDGGTNTVTFSDGKKLNIKNGKAGSDGQPGKDGAPGVDGQPGQDGEDGVGIASIEQTTTSTVDGGNNVFTVTLTNGQKATFTVKNGSKGSTGAAGKDGADGKNGSDATVTEASIKSALGYTPADAEDLGQLSAEKEDKPAPVVGTPIGEKCAEFAYLMNHTDKVESFVFFTDPHLAGGDSYEEQMRSYLKTLKAYYDASPTSFVVCGGDWIGNSDTQKEACFKLGFIDAQMRSNFDRYYHVIGNHDTNYQGVAEDGAEAFSGTLTKETIRNLMLRNEENLYYSFDGASTKFYVLDSGLDWDNTMTDYRWGQVDWLAKKLLEDDALHSAIAVHIMYSGGNLHGMAPNIIDIASAYNNKSSITLNGIAYDFTATTGSVRFIIAGHTHTDSVATERGIPIIITTHTRDGSTPTFDLCLADYESNKLHLVRVGTGENREVIMWEKEESTVIFTPGFAVSSGTYVSFPSQMGVVSTVPTGGVTLPIPNGNGVTETYYHLALPEEASSQITVTCPGMLWSFVARYINSSGTWSNYFDSQWQESGVTFEKDLKYPTHYLLKFKFVDGGNFPSDYDPSGISWEFS